MKIVAWIIIGCVILIFLGLIFYLIIGAILFHLSLGRKELKKRVKKNNLKNNLEKYQIDLCWWDKIEFKKVEIKSVDNLKLVGHFLDQKSKVTILLVHGYSANYKEMQPYAKFFYQKGYNLLCVENRAHGDSEGDCVGMGYFDRLDIKGWINFLNENNKSKIILFGLSMGASAVCGASEDLPNNVVAVISDSAFDNVEKQIKYILKKFGIFKNLLFKILKSYTKRRYEFNLSDGNFVKCVKKSKIPILYFHGKADRYVLPECSMNLYEATPENLRELCLVDDAEHAMSYVVLGNMYERKINRFLNKYKILED